MTTGAGNDIEKATEIAHKMVCEWGMSEKLGPLAYGKKEESIFLGRDYGQRTQDYSEQTAQEIDQEVRAIVQRQYVSVKDHLTQSRDKLQRLADALIERETLDAEEIRCGARGARAPEAREGDHPDVRREGQGEQREAPRREHLRRPAEARHQRLLIVAGDRRSQGGKETRSRGRWLSAPFLFSSLFSFRGRAGRGGSDSRNTVEPLPN